MRIAGLLTIFLITPFVAFAALININTADAALLDTLPGIGPSKAAAIIDYRTQHGLFVHIEDIQNVSGIGPSTYADIAPLITVGGTVSTTTNTTTTATSTVSTASSGSASFYTPPPTTLTLELFGTEKAVLNVSIPLIARLTTKSGTIDSSAQVTWSFGDGSSAVGTNVEKTYRYPGTYLVTVLASDGEARAREEMTIKVTSALVRISTITSDGIIVANDSLNRLDLSGWRLRTDTGLFRIPDGMTILPQANVLFPFTIMNMPVTFSATLTYPSGGTAAQYPSAQTAVSTDPGSALSLPAETQLPASGPGYTSVQEVESISSKTTSVTKHEEPAIAPTATSEPVAVGAPATAEQVAAVATAPATGIFRSPWTLSFMGLLAIAGGVFIFL